jgi:hypothetical protein
MTTQLHAVPAGFIDARTGTIDVVPIRLTFKHTVSSGGCGSVKGQRITYAYLRATDTGSLVGVGVAQTHPKDQFNKEVGRKLALERALNNLPLRLDTKANRRAVWQAYLGRTQQAAAQEVAA